MKGISPLISFALTILLIVVSVTIVLTTILPAFDRLQDSNVLDDGVKNLQLLDTAIRQVASEAEGSKRTINLRFGAGKLKVDASNELISFEFETKSDFNIEGLVENVYVDKSPIYLEYFDKYGDSEVPAGWQCMGSCFVESGQFAINGSAWINLGKIKNFRLDAKIVNESGIAEAFFVPGSYDNLVLYLPFDEGKGNVSYDYSKYGNDGTLLDANTSNADGNTPPVWVDGKFGKALSFDGVDDYVEVPAFSKGPRLTISFWVKFLSFPANQFENLVGDGEGSYDFCWMVYRTRNAQTIRPHIHTTDGIFLFDSATTLEAGKWYHIVETTDGSNIRLYINGVEDPNSPMAYTGTPINTDNRVFIGRDLREHPPNAIIDEVRIYNRALTADEIKAEYQLTLKKLILSGITDTINQEINASLVLASPTAKNYFDNIKVKTNQKKLLLTIPYARVDLRSNLSLGPGNNQVVVEKIGINQTTNKPIVRVRALS